MLTPSLEAISHAKGNNLSYYFQCKTVEIYLSAKMQDTEHGKDTENKSLTASCAL